MGNLLLTRKHYLPISFAFDLARLGFEAWMVIGLRAAKLAMGGPAAMLEAQRMVAEKTAAMLEDQAAAGMAIATGSSKAAVAQKAIAPYRRRVKENRRRLTHQLKRVRGLLLLHPLRCYSAIALAAGGS